MGLKVIEENRIEEHNLLSYKFYYGHCLQCHPYFEIIDYFCVIRKFNANHENFLCVTQASFCQLAYLYFMPNTWFQ